MTSGHVSLSTLIVVEVWQLSKWLERPAVDNKRTITANRWSTVTFGKDTGDEAGRSSPHAIRGPRREATGGADSAGGPSEALEKHYTVQEIAHAWNVSEDTIRRVFRDVAGVIHPGAPTRLVGRKYKRGHEILRIPESIEQKIRNPQPLNRTMDGAEDRALRVLASCMR